MIRDDSPAEVDLRRLMKAWSDGEIVRGTPEDDRLANLFDLDFDALDRSISRTDGWVSMDDVQAVIDRHPVLSEISKLDSGVITILNRTMPERHWTALLWVVRHWRRRLQ